MRKNIVVSGATGSGNTTLTKGLVLEIPSEERLAVLEDAPELSLASHPNSVRPLYSKDGQWLALVSAKQLLEVSVRLRPGRILLAELRGEEAHYYLRNVTSGHLGSTTSIHASSAPLAFGQRTMLVKESPAGRELARSDIRALLYLMIDMVVRRAAAHGAGSMVAKGGVIQSTTLQRWNICFGLLLRIAAVHVEWVSRAGVYGANRPNK